jgi:hypothetical protein
MRRFVAEMIMTLRPGSHTGPLRGGNHGVGIGLAEVSALQQAE